MATTNLYLDTRCARADGTYPLKLKITLNGTQGFLLNLQTTLEADQWDRRRQRVIRHRYAPDLNRYLSEKQTDVEMLLRTLERSGELYTLPPRTIKEKLVRQSTAGSDPDRHPFGDFFTEFARQRNREGTRKTYARTHRERSCRQRPRLCVLRQLPAGADGMLMTTTRTAI